MIAGRKNPVAEKSMAFAVKIVSLYRTLAAVKNERIMARQVLRSGTSIGANIREANSAQSKADFISKMRARDILTVFHYLPLHTSEFYRGYAEGHRPSKPGPASLPNCDRYADTLVRLPLYCGLAPDQDAVLAAAEESLAR